MADRAGPSADQLLAKFNIEELLGPHPPRTNFNVFFVDDQYALRIARVQDTFPAHRHLAGDEGWFVHRGRLRIDTEVGSVELSAGEGARIPRGMRHSPSSLEDGTLVIVINIRGLTIEFEAGHDATSEGFREIDLPQGGITGAASGTETDPSAPSRQSDSGAAR